MSERIVYGESAFPKHSAFATPVFDNASETNQQDQKPDESIKKEASSNLEEAYEILNRLVDTADVMDREDLNRVRDIIYSNLR